MRLSAQAFFCFIAALALGSCSLLARLRPPEPPPSPVPTTTTTVAAASAAAGSAPAGSAALGAAAAAGAATSVTAPRPPVSLEQYRSGKIDPRAKLQASPALAAAYRPSTQEGLRQVSQALLEGETDPFAKVKLIHDWICATITYDTAMLKSGNAVNQDIQNVLASGKAVCSGYSRVFQALADMAGIPCVTVSGYIKNQRGVRGLSQDNSHAWNLVQILGRWYIVDTTFDAGYVKDWVFVKKYSTANLFIDPARSIYSRFPKEAWQQLLPSPISGEEFLALPDLESDFFYYSLELTEPRPSWENRTQGTFSLELSSKDQDIVLEGVLYNAAGREIPGAVFIQHPAEGRHLLLISPPSKGDFSFELYAKKQGEERIEYLIDAVKFEQKALAPLDQRGRTELLASFKKITTPRAYLFSEDPFDQGQKQRVITLLRQAGYSLGPLKKVLALTLVNQAPAQAASYPVVYARYQNSPDDSLLSPLSGRLKAGSDVLFLYRSPGSSEAALIVGKEFFSMEKNSEGVFELSLKIPAAAELRLGLSEDGKNYDIALAWQIEP